MTMTVDEALADLIPKRDALNTVITILQGLTAAAAPATLGRSAEAPKRRSAEAPKHQPTVPSPKPGGRDDGASRRGNADAIRTALMRGKTPAEVAELFGCTAVNASQHRRRLVAEGKLQPLGEKSNRRVQSKEEIDAEIAAIGNDDEE